MLYTGIESASIKSERLVTGIHFKRIEVQRLMESDTKSFAKKPSVISSVKMFTLSTYMRATTPGLSHRFLAYGVHFHINCTSRAQFTTNRSALYDSIAVETMEITIRISGRRL